ncbi:MAG: type I DNA topoisomerase [Candidatus Levyibacteriota bacterium]
MKLVIVESPTKARTIGKFLGKDYTIKASMGHVVDLPKSKLSIDVEHGFRPLYEQVADKKQIIVDLKSAAKSADVIILATDPDREGEAIASHVKDVLSLKSKTKNQNSKFNRIVFHEITKEAIEEALKNPRGIDKNLVDAQTARRVLDRLVGYKLSPLLWKKVRRGLSAGRVQSVALRLIVEREREIEKFGKEKYWTIAATLTKEAIQTEFELIEIDGQKIEVAKAFDLYDGQYKVTKTSINNIERAKEIVVDLKTKTFKVSDVLQKETKRSPTPPYTTSTLQQDAARRLGINGKRTMSLAQKLYEEGYITYHRTDSITIGGAATSAIINFVKKEYGNKYVPEKPRFYSAKQKLAQEAHEAIRPTKASVLGSEISQNLGGAYGKLYDLIWKRAVASQMSDAIVESTTVMVDVQPYKLKANGSVLVFDGFLKVNPLGLSDNKLPKFESGEKLNPVDVLEEEHETLPPPRYNDASIIKTLEEKGIGRPSTYATIISTIESRGYIERGASTGGSGRGFYPTAVGIAVNDFLVKNFSDIDDIPFTASMEDSLDQIANGEKKWEPMMKDFYTPFEKKLTEVEGAERVKIAVEETDEKCPTCSAPLVVRTGKFGKFLACSTFPTCKFTKPFVENTGLTCPKCGGNVVVKKTKKGRRFYGCSNYPKCDFASWKLEDIKGKQIHN